MNFRSGRRRREVTMDLTPMIDVVFLLLIFFLVTATFTQEDQRLIPILLPDAATGESADAHPPAAVTIAEDGRLTLSEPGGDAIDVSETGELRSALELLYANDPSTTIRLRGDTNAPYGRIMEVWDMAREVGFPRVDNEVFAQ